MAVGRARCRTVLLPCCRAWSQCGWTGWRARGRAGIGLPASRIAASMAVPETTRGWGDRPHGPLEALQCWCQTACRGACGRRLVSVGCKREADGLGRRVGLRPRPLNAENVGRPKAPGFGGQAGRRGPRSARGCTVLRVLSCGRLGSRTCTGARMF